MDALVTAGGIPEPGDPLYEYTQGQSKSLLDMAGKPMVQWVLDALGGAKLVDRIVIVGLDESSGLTCAKPLAYVPNQGGMIANIRAGTEKIQELNPEGEYILIAASDIPTITPEIVDWAIETALESNHAMYYNAIERSVMEARFPGSNRTYTSLKGIQVAGGDLNVLASWTVVAQEGLWDRLQAVRKNPLKQAALVGIDTLLMILFRIVDLDGAARQATKRLGFPCRAILCPHAEIGMDVDKPHQLELLRADLAQRNSA
ncbi:MAG: nucleotidyltransferase family protein [Anaerolineae bacterium]|nr:nucleotidyltransferase family protein [Anaerolineae bacterium]